MIRLVSLIFIVVLMAAPSAHAQGFWLPWGGNKEKTEKKPAEIVKPRGQNSQSNPLFLGKATNDVAKTPEKKTLKIGDKSFEIEKDILTSKGAAPQNLKELKMVAALRRAPALMAVRKKALENDQKIARAEMVFEQKAALRTQQTARAAQKLKAQNAALMADTSGENDVSIRPVSFAAPEERQRTPAKAIQPKPSLFIRKDRASDTEQKKTGVFTDY